MALIIGGVVLAIASAFAMTQVIGSKSVSVSQRAPVVTTAPQSRVWFAPHNPAIVTADDQIAAALRAAAGDAVTSAPQGQVWYASRNPAIVTADDQIAAALRAAALTAGGDAVTTAPQSQVWFAPHRVATVTADDQIAAALAAAKDASTNGVRHHAPGRGPLR